MGNCLAKDGLHSNDALLVSNLEAKGDQASSKSTADELGEDDDSRRTTEEEKRDYRSDLRPAAKVFCDTFDSYMRCRKKLNAKFSEIKELQLIAQHPMESQFGCDVKCQQQSCAGATVKTLDELYIAAEIAQKVFSRSLTRVIALLDEAEGAQSSNIKVNFMRLKEKGRAHAKAYERYVTEMPGPAVSWVTDIARASIVFRSSDQIIKCLKILQTDPAIHIVNVKNRFLRPTLTGYRDVLVHFQIDTGIGFQHICELQLHHTAMNDLGSRLNSFQYYEYFRPFFCTTATTKLVQDLTLINRGVADGDDTFLAELVGKKVDVDQLAGLGKLFEDLLVEYSWALCVYEKLFQVQLVKFGPKCVHTTETLNNLGRVFYKQDNLEAAGEKFRKALETVGLSDGNANPYIGDTYKGLASVLSAQGKVEASLEMSTKALGIEKKMLGTQHMSVAKLYNNMAVGERQQGKLDEALALYQKSLDIYIRRLGSEHSDVADAYSNMAGILSIQRKLKHSLKLYQKSVDIYKESLGEHHESIAEAYENMAVVLQRQNQSERSIAMYLRALDVLIEVLGDWHSKLASTYQEMAKIYYSLGKLDEAIAMHTKALESYKKTLGPEHVSVGDAYFNIGGILYRKEQYSDALQMLEKAQAIYSNTQDQEKAAQIAQVMEVIRSNNGG